jgi:hypothetical protein
MGYASAMATDKNGEGRTSDWHDFYRYDINSAASERSFRFRPD